MASASTFERHYVATTSYIRVQRLSEWKHRRNDQSRQQRFFSVTSCMQIRAHVRPFQVKAMFKQHVNLMIWTWILRLQTAWRNEFPCKNCGLSLHRHPYLELVRGDSPEQSLLDRLISTTVSCADANVGEYDVWLFRLAPVLKTIFHQCGVHQCVISYTCSQSNSDGSVIQIHQS